MKVNDSKVIEMFEEAVAEYAGSKYGVAISSQTNAVFLCLELLKMKGILKEKQLIQIPKRTYMSIPMTILNVGMHIEFADIKWSGAYKLQYSRHSPDEPEVWDSAVRFTKDMYVTDSLYCVSFQYKKALPIGRGGMILTNNEEDKILLQQLRFNGRTNGVSQANDNYTIRGWNMYMLPEQAARGLTLMTMLPDKNKDIASFQDYPDVSKQFSKELLE